MQINMSTTAFARPRVTTRSQTLAQTQSAQILDENSIKGKPSALAEKPTRTALATVSQNTQIPRSTAVINKSKVAGVVKPSAGVTLQRTIAAVTKPTLKPSTTATATATTALARAAAVKAKSDAAAVDKYRVQAVAPPAPAPATVDFLEDSIEEMDDAKSDDSMEEEPMEIDGMDIEIKPVVAAPLKKRICDIDTPDIGDPQFSLNTWRKSLLTLERRRLRLALTPSIWTSSPRSLPSIAPS